MFSIIPSRDVAAANDAFNNSAPSILRSPPPSDDHNNNSDTIRRGGSNHSIDSLMRKRSSMSSRTLHESLHRGKSSSSSNTTIDGEECCIRRSVSFSQVNIREYERVRGVNSDVFGTPLSIGWRYSPDQITHDISDYEQAKGSPRSTNEFLVPARVRERMIKEFEKGDDNNNSSSSSSSSGSRIVRRHSISFGKEEKKQTKREKFMDISRKVKEALKPPSLARIPPYEEREKQLWDEAHQIAIEKAKRLEDSIRRGDSVSSIDLYAVGSPQCNILPSRRNSKKVAATISTDDMGGDQSNQSGNIVVTENEDLISELIEAADCEA